MKKKELIEKLFDINIKYAKENGFSDDTRKLLDKFLGNLLSIRKTPTELSYKTKLETLTNLANGSDELAYQIIRKAIENCWAGFYPLKTSSSSYVFTSNTNTFANNKSEIKLSNKEY